MEWEEAQPGAAEIAAPEGLLPLLTEPAEWVVVEAQRAEAEADKEPVADVVTTTEQEDALRDAETRARNATGWWGNDPAVVATRELQRNKRAADVGFQMSGYLRHRPRASVRTEVSR